MPSYVGDALLAHAKAGCYRCLRGSDLVDLDVQIEGEGALVLCRGCVGEAAEACKLTFNEAVVRDLTQQLSDAHAQLDHARRREAVFNQALDDAIYADRCGQTTKAGTACKNKRNQCVAHATPLLEVL